MANTKEKSKVEEEKPSGYSLAYSDERAAKFRQIKEALKKKTGISATRTQILDSALDAFLVKVK